MTIDPSLTIAIVALLGVIISPLVAGRIAHKAKEEEWERQDIVAARAEQVAAQAAEAAALLLEQNKVVAAATAQVDDRLQQIHVLVNSNLTAAHQAEYDAVNRELAANRRYARLAKKAGEKVPVDVVDAIKRGEMRVKELGALLNDRAKQTEIADKQVKKNSG